MWVQFVGTEAFSRNHEEYLVIIEINFVFDRPLKAFMGFKIIQELLFFASGCFYKELSFHECVLENNGFYWDNDFDLYKNYL